MKIHEFINGKKLLNINHFLFFSVCISWINVLIYFINVENTVLGINRVSDYKDSMFLSIYLFINYFMLFSLIKITLNLFNLLKIKVLIILKDIIFYLIITLFLIISFIDSFLYKILGININDSIILQEIKVGSLFKATSTSLLKTIIYLIIIIILTIILYFSNKLLYKLVFLQKKQTFIVILTYIIITNIFYIFFNIKKSEIVKITYFNQLFITSNINEYSINYYSVDNIDIPNPQNIILVISESLRGDIFIPEIMPDLYNFINNHNCITSERHYSGSHSTVPSIFSLLYGIDSYYVNLFDKKDITLENKSTFLSILKNNGYNTVFLNSSSIYHEYIYDNFNIHKEFPTDAMLFSEIENVVKKINSNKNLFIIFLNTSHYSYYFPQNFAKFKPYLENSEITNDSILINKKNKDLMFNRYKNSAFYVGFLFNKIMDILKQKIDINNSIVVFIGDHGEEFWEKGYYGHVKVAFNNERTTTPFLLCSNNISNTNVKLSTHYNIFPTIFDILKVDKYPNKKNNSLLKQNDNYYILSNVGFPYKDKKFALISEQGKIIFNILSGIKKNPIIEKLEYTDLNDNVLEEKEKINILNKHLEEFKKIT